MKIIKTAKYKILESAWEGQSYGPHNEDEWLNTIKEKSNAPTVNKIQPRNKNRARFRPSGLDSVPISALPSAQRHEMQRTQMFDSNLEKQKQKNIDIEEKRKQKHLDVKNWIASVRGEEARSILNSFYRKTLLSQPENSGLSGLFNLLYNASLGKEKSLREVSRRLGEDVVLETGLKNVKNPDFFYNYGTK